MTARAAIASEIVLQNAAGHDGDAVARLERWLAELVAALAPDVDSFTGRLADDDEVQRWNARLRGHDRPTDVLSFPGETTPDGVHLGDVLIALPTARRQAERLGHPLDRELRELLLHGLLHCLGHDHETDDGEMAALELELRRRWIDDA